MVREEVLVKDDETVVLKNEKAENVSFFSYCEYDKSAVEACEKQSPVSASVPPQSDNACTNDMTEWKNRIKMACIFMNGNPFDKHTHIKMRWRLTHFKMKEMVLKRIPEYEEVITDGAIPSCVVDARPQTVSLLGRFRRRLSKFFTRFVSSCGVARIPDHYCS